MRPVHPFPSVSDILQSIPASADALSRAPLLAPEKHPGLDIDTAISCLLQTSHPTIDMIYNSIDDNYCLLLDDIKNNTSFSTYSQSLKAYLNILSISNLSLIHI